MREREGGGGGGGGLPDTESTGGEESGPGTPVVIRRNERGDSSATEPPRIESSWVFWCLKEDRERFGFYLHCLKMMLTTTKDHEALK
jgi:hypothetical protein